MSLRLSRISIAIFWSTLWVFQAGPAHAGIKSFKKQKRQTIKQDAKDYQQCRKDILKKALKKGGKKAAKEAIALCQDQFPAAFEVVNCKRKAVLNFKKKPKKLRSEVARCMKEYKKIGFNPSAKVPFAIKDDRLFFAGLGLNLPKKFQDQSFGNFSCKPIQDYFKGNGPAEFLLFGNNPKIFRGFKKVKPKKMMKMMGIDRNGPDPQLSDEFGQVFNIKKPKKTAAYFPISFCHFNKKMGPHFEAMKAYYLADKETKFIYPYFGISFYRSGTKIKVPELVRNLRSTLGSQYKVQIRKKDYVYVGASAFKEFDSEGDPYNLCKQVAKHRYVALIRKKNKTPEYLVIANVKNMCRFGERISSRLSKSH